MPETYVTERRRTAEERYTELAQKREAYLIEARSCSELTIPRLIPPENIDQGEQLATPAQSDGAKCVNGLSAGIMMSTLPPNIPVMRLEVGRLAETIQEEESDEETKAKLEKSDREARKNLDRIPRECLRITETHAHRPKVFEGIKHLVVGGSVLYWFLDDKKNYGKIRSVPLSRFVVLRDSLSFPLEVIIRDGLSASNLPKKLAEMAKDGRTAEEVLADESGTKSDSVVKNFALYTYACWDPDVDKYRFHQEFEGQIVDGSEALYTIENFPLCPLRFSSSDGEDYGRGLVEEYRGVLMAIEALAQAETALAIAMAETRIAIDPASGIRPSEYTNAAAGAPLPVKADHIKAISLEKVGDLNAIRQSKLGLQHDLGRAFLDYMSVQRDAERVTAEEIRTMIQILERTLGGLYAALATEFLEPYVRFLLRILKREQGIDINTNGSGAIRPRVITGLEALGQSSEYGELVGTLKDIGALLGPNGFAQKVNADAMSDRLMGLKNIEGKGLFKSNEQLQAEIKQERLAAQNQAVAPHMIQSLTKVATEQAA